MDVYLSKDAQKEFNRLSKSDRDKIKKKLLAISENPHIGKKLIGELVGILSVRAWPYRILYEINLKKRVEVHKIAHRQGIYKS